MRLSLLEAKNLLSFALTHTHILPLNASYVTELRGEVYYVLEYKAAGAASNSAVCICVVGQNYTLGVSSPKSYDKRTSGQTD